MEALKDSIGCLRLANSEFRYFIPEVALFQLLTKNKVEEICKHMISTSRPEVHDDLITTIVSGGRKVFAILILCDHPEAIIDFINVVDQFQPSSLDYKLPFDINTLQRVLTNIRAKKFHEVQWELSTPRLSSTGIPRCLEPEIILPFSKNRRFDEGGFGVMYNVEINKEHHMLEIPYSNPAGSPSEVLCLVRKELLPHAKDYEVELRNLSLLKLIKHSNIISLLACYTYRDTHNFLFPRATGGDLGELLSKDPPEAFKCNEEYFTALSGLASALHRVHHLAVDTLNIKLIGCHHDLKPKNILIEGSRFLLADFGLSRFKLESDGSSTPYRERNGYEIAPECQDLDDDDEIHDINRSSDIWSFGCILAYVLVYMKEGPDGIKSFKEARRFKRKRTTYYYFHCGNESNEGMHEYLHRLEPSCSPSEMMILKLIRKILVLPPGDRPDSSYVMAALDFAALHALSQPILARYQFLRDAIIIGQTRSEILIEEQRFLSWQWALGLVDNEQVPVSDFEPNSNCEDFESALSTLSMLRQVLDHFDVSQGNTRRRLVFPVRQLNASLLGILTPMAQLGARNFLDTELLSTESPEFLDHLAQYSSTSETQGLADTKKKTLSVQREDKTVRKALEMDYSPTFKSKWLGRHSFSLDAHINSRSECVLVEWKEYEDPVQRQSILPRIREIAALLTSISPDPGFRILQCRGYCHDQDPYRHAFGLVYSFPPGISGPQARVQTLKSMLGRQSRTALPDLSSRFTLAYRISSTVLAFHQASWLHKSLAASNIAFFRLSGSRPVPILNDPHIIGFVHSRPDKANIFTEGPGNNQDDKDYSHPDYIDNDKRFEPWFDYYSLGLILFEIGMWRPLDQLTSPAGSPREMLRMLVTNQMSKLQLRAGRVYSECVHNCLDGSLEGSHLSGNVVEPAERRSAAIHVKFGQSVVSKLARLASYEI